MAVGNSKFVNITLKNNVTINYNIEKELKSRNENGIARFLKQTLEQHYRKIKNVDLKFNVSKLKQDMEKRTSALMLKTFKK